MYTILSETEVDVNNAASTDSFENDDADYESDISSVSLASSSGFSTKPSYRRNSKVDDDSDHLAGSLVDEDTDHLTGSLVDDNPDHSAGSLVDDNPDHSTGSSVDDDPDHLAGSLVKTNTIEVNEFKDGTIFEDNYSLHQKLPLKTCPETQRQRGGGPCCCHKHSTKSNNNEKKPLSRFFAEEDESTTCCIAIQQPEARIVEILERPPPIPVKPKRPPLHTPKYLPKERKIVCDPRCGFKECKENLKLYLIKDRLDRGRLCLEAERAKFEAALAAVQAEKLAILKSQKREGKLNCNCLRNTVNIEEENLPAETMAEEVIEEEEELIIEDDSSLYDVFVKTETPPWTVHENIHYGGMELSPDPSYTVQYSEEKLELVDGFSTAFLEEGLKALELLNELNPVDTEEQILAGASRVEKAKSGHKKKKMELLKPDDYIKQHDFSNKGAFNFVKEIGVDFESEGQTLTSKIAAGVMMDTRETMAKRVCGEDQEKMMAKEAEARAKQFAEMHGQKAATKPKESVPKPTPEKKGLKECDSKCNCLFTHPVSECCRKNDICLANLQKFERHLRNRARGIYSVFGSDELSLEEGEMSAAERRKILKTRPTSGHHLRKLLEQLVPNVEFTRDLNQNLSMITVPRLIDDKADSENCEVIIFMPLEEEAAGKSNKGSKGKNRKESLLSHTNDDKKRRQSSLNSTSDDKRQRKSTLNRTNDDKKRRQSSLNSTSDDKRQRKSTLNRTNDDKKRRQSSLNSTSDDKRQRKSTLNSTNDDKKQRQSSLNSTNDDKRQRKSTLNSTNDDKKRRQSSLNSTNDDKRQRKSTLNSTNDDKKRRQSKKEQHE